MNNKKLLRNYLQNTKIRKKLAEKKKYSVNTNFSKKVQNSLLNHSYIYKLKDSIKIPIKTEGELEKFK